MDNKKRIELLDKHNMCHKCEKAKQFPNRKFCAECLEKITLTNIQRYGLLKHMNIKQGEGNYIGSIKPMGFVFDVQRLQRTEFIAMNIA